MDTYAIIETGAKQYKVCVGQVIEIERLPQKSGEDVAIKEVLAISDGNEIKLGTPYVDGASVTLSIVDDSLLGEKVVNFKKRRRKGYARKVGHRQDLTKAVVKAIA